MPMSVSVLRRPGADALRREREDGIGGDFDGISATVSGLNDVSTYPALFAELIHRGWSDDDLKKLAGENVLRVLSRAEEVAARLQKTRLPSTKTIAQLDGKK